MVHLYHGYVSHYQRVYISLDISMIYPYDLLGIPWESQVLAVFNAPQKAAGGFSGWTNRGGFLWKAENLQATTVGE